MVILARASFVQLAIILPHNDSSRIHPAHDDEDVGNSCLPLSLPIFLPLPLPFPFRFSFLFVFFLDSKHRLNRFISLAQQEEGVGRAKWLVAL